MSVSSQFQTLRLIDDEAFPRAPQQARSRAKRDALLQAALELFGERGYEAVGVEEIVERARASVGAFYSYFRSKQQLLLALMQRYIEVMQGLDLLATGGGVGSPAVVAELLQRALAPDRAYAGLWRAWQEATLTQAELAPLDERLRGWMRAYVVAIIEGARPSGRLRPDLDMQATAETINALALQLAQRPHAPDDALLRAAAAMIYHALFVDAVGAR